MDRRTTLSTVGGALVGVVAGCLTSFPPDSGDDGDREGDPLQYEVRYSKDPNDVLLVEPGLGHGSAIESPYATVITDAAGRDRFDYDYMNDQEDIDDGIVTFVEETRFEEACLVVVQTVLPSGTMDFELEAVRRESDKAIHAYTTTPPISGGTGEVLRATIFTRVFLDGSAAPDRVTVTYSNDPNAGGGTTTFTSDDADR